MRVVRTQMLVILLLCVTIRKPSCHVYQLLTQHSRWAIHATKTVTPTHN